MSCFLPDMSVSAQFLQGRLRSVVHGLAAIFRDLSNGLAIKGICQCEVTEEGHSTLGGRQVSFLDNSGRYVFVGGHFSQLPKFTRRHLTVVENPIFFVGVEDLGKKSYECYLYVNVISLLPYKIEIYFPDSRFSAIWLTWQRDGLVRYRELTKGFCPSTQDDEDSNQPLNQGEIEGESSEGQQT